MRQKIALFWLIASISLTRCAFLPGAPQAATATPLTSGIEGQTWLGSVCPAAQVGASCPDRPYADARLTVIDASGKEIARLHTDAQGRFRLLLAPGNYTLHPEPLEGLNLPPAPEQTFTVTDGQFTTLTVLYKSGIQ